VENIWAAGEAACVSLHGANRLGSNSTAECLVWGKITGQQAATYVLKRRSFIEVDPGSIKEVESEVQGRIDNKGNENAYVIRIELNQTMDKKVGVFRDEKGLKDALDKIHELKEKLLHVKINDHSRIYNTELLNVFEIQNLLDLSEIVVGGALRRKESRGAHARRDYKERDDAHWLKHTLAFYSDAGPKFEYLPVAINFWKPVERKY